MWLFWFLAGIGSTLAIEAIALSALFAFGAAAKRHDPHWDAALRNRRG